MLYGAWVELIALTLGRLPYPMLKNLPFVRRACVYITASIFGLGIEKIMFAIPGATIIVQSHIQEFASIVKPVKSISVLAFAGQQAKKLLPTKVIDQFSQFAKLKSSPAAIIDI